MLLAGLSVAFANEMQPSFVARMSTQHNIYAGHKMRAQTLASSMRPSEGRPGNQELVVAISRYAHWDEAQNFGGATE